MLCDGHVMVRFTNLLKWTSNYPTPCTLAMDANVHLHSDRFIATGKLKKPRVGLKCCPVDVAVQFSDVCVCLCGKKRSLVTECRAEYYSIICWVLSKSAIL